MSSSTSKGRQEIAMYEAHIFLLNAAHDILAAPFCVPMQGASGYVFVTEPRTQERTFIHSGIYGQHTLLH